MATLTDEQTNFLKSHHIPLDKAFDASGLSSKDYKAKMKQNGTLVAYGVPPCPKGHTLKNKQANCLQCNPQAISAIKRQATAGQLYIATAPSNHLLKISTTESASMPTTLENQLNQDQHAGISDWQVVYLADVASIGEIENQLQQRLNTHQIKRKLSANSKAIKASEVFDIDIHDVLDLFKTWQIMPSFHNDEKIAQSHDHYSQKLAQIQQEQQRLTEQQAKQLHAQEQAKLAEKQRQQQQLLEEQERAKLAKLEQKRQKQAQLEQQRVDKLAKQQTTRQNSANSLNKQNLLASNNTGTSGTLTKTPKNTPNSITVTNHSIWQKLTPQQWTMVAVGMVVLLGVIIFAATR